MSSINEVLAGLRATSAWQERVYKDLHAHPELSFQETRTAALAASKLRGAGYEVVEGVGVAGVLRNGEGRTVLARADMDALPVEEKTGLPYASTRSNTGAPTRPDASSRTSRSTIRNTLRRSSGRRCPQGRALWWSPLWRTCRSEEGGRRGCYSPR